MSSINRRHALRLLGTAALAPAILRGRYQVFAQSPAAYSARTIQLVESSIVVDLLNQFQFPDYSVKPPKIEQWMTLPGTFTKEDAQRYITSGITVFGLGLGAEDYQDGLRFYAQWNGFLAGYSDWLTQGRQGG